jgi:ADP-ribose pyrophosphatase
MGREIYRGRIVNLSIEAVHLPTGVAVDLELIRHPGAAAVVAVAGSEVVLLRQYRFAAAGYLWEIPAGTLHPGEEPDACARRELREEAGLESDEIVRLGEILTAPGFCDERIQIYLARGLREVGVARDLDEVITEVRRLTWDRVLGMIATGEIVDAKTLVGLYHAHAWLGREAGRP